MINAVVKKITGWIAGIVVAKGLMAMIVVRIAAAVYIRKITCAVISVMVKAAGWYV